MGTKDVRNFLLVTGSGILVALLVLFWVVRIDNYEQGVYAGQLLLSPPNADRVSRTQSGADILVESIDYSYFLNGKWEMVSLDSEPYKKLWSVVEGDRGAVKVDPEIVKLFDDPKLSMLAIYMRKEVPYQKEGLNKLYQQMQLPPVGDYYRIQIPEQENKAHWVYFYHPAIQKILLGELAKNG